MSKSRIKPATPDTAADQPSEIPATRRGDSPLPDAFTQIREAQPRIIAAVIARAEQDGSYQHAKWLFEYGGLLPASHSGPDNDPSLVRLFLDQLQIPETPEELAAELSANDHAVE